MLARVTFVLITMFWVTMNVLLWRSEFGAHHGTGGEVPLETVWRKMLSAPDASSLNIFQRGKKIGFCYWANSVNAVLLKVREDTTPEGMVERVSGYSVQLDGNAAISGLTDRIRFNFNLTLTTNQAWQEFNLKLVARPTTFEVHSVAAEQSFSLKATNAESSFERVFKYSELQNPGALLAEFVGPFGGDWLGGLGLPMASTNASTLQMAIKWSGRNDWMTIGHSPVRVYRLQAQLMDRYQAVVLISSVGEILRVELPEEIVLVNDQLGNP